MRVDFQSGIYLPEIDFWLDPTKPQGRAFVSHAHSDHVARHAQFIVTPATAALLDHRYRPKGQMQEQRFGERRDFGEFSLTLYPAGHILGSAQALIEHDGHRLLYDLVAGRGRDVPSSNPPSASRATSSHRRRR